jgi:hypothetical protein
MIWLTLTIAILNAPPEKINGEIFNVGLKTNLLMN